MTNNTLAERVREVVEDHRQYIINNSSTMLGDGDRALIDYEEGTRTVESMALALLDLLIEDMEKKREDATTDYAGTCDELDSAYASGCYNTRSGDIDDLKELRDSLSITKQDHE